MSLILLLIGSSVLLCMETSHQYLTDLKLLEVWGPQHGQCKVLPISAYPYYFFSYPKGPCTQIVGTWAQCTYVRPKYILFGTCASYALMSRASREA